MDILAYILGKNSGSGDVTKLEAEIGEISNLTTDDKTDLVSAINEIDAAIDTKTVTLEESNSESYVKVYTIKQGSDTLGTINIPKDMVVSSGTVEVINDTTYIVLTLANATSDKIYVDVGSLVDIYTAESGASSVQITIDATTREISAVLVDGAVTTAKIADAAVTKAKLATSVQTSLDSADSAVQSVTTGSSNGTIAVDGTNVSVKGLGSAAYTDSTAYDTAGAANTVKTAVIGTSSDSASASTIYGAKAYTDDAIDSIYWTLENETLTMHSS